MIVNLGVRANPVAEVVSDTSMTYLRCVTAWTPCVELVAQLHAVTGWDIEHRFFDPMSYGGIQRCTGGTCHITLDEEERG